MIPKWRNTTENPIVAERACPRCEAQPGHRCVTTSGKRAETIHVRRGHDSRRAGVIYHSVEAFARAIRRALQPPPQKPDAKCKICDGSGEYPCKWGGCYVSGDHTHRCQTCIRFVGKGERMHNVLAILDEVDPPPNSESS